MLSGLLTGAAFSFYSTAILLTDVVRALLLFYLMPIWGTILGFVFLGERMTLYRVLALLGAVAGLLVVLGTGSGWPWPKNAGDWLALASGISWALGSLRLYQMGHVGVPEQVVAFVFGSIVVTAGTLLFGGVTFTGGVHSIDVAAIAPWALLMGVYVAPMLVLTVWPAMLLTPGRIGILLMSDVVVGVGSAAALAGEPFGWREATGTVLIVGAAFVEVLGRQKSDVTELR